VCLIQYLTSQKAKLTVSGMENRVFKSSIYSASPRRANDQPHLTRCRGALNLEAPFAVLMLSKPVEVLPKKIPEDQSKSAGTQFLPSRDVPLLLQNVV